MNSRLPQELQTRKVTSLPDDIRSVVEDLIIQKFDIPEVVGGESGPGFFDPSQVAEAFNILELSLRSVTGQIYRLAQMMPLHLSGLNSYRYMGLTDSGAHPVFYEYTKRITCEIDKRARDIGPIGEIRATMNGYTDIITSPDSLTDFLARHYRDRQDYYGVDYGRKGTRYL